jgi:hypothetical protein
VKAELAQDFANGTTGLPVDGDTTESALLPLAIGALSGDQDLVDV